MASIFTDTSLYAGNKLGLINQCLSSIGQRPLIEGTIIEDLQVGSEGRIAGDIVGNVMREVQVKGWYFNTDINFKFDPDINGFIAVPENLLRIDVGNTSNRSNIMIKDNKFYNRITQDYIFTETVVADAVWLIDYEQLPFLAYQYIGARASVKFQQKALGDPNLNAELKQTEAEAYDDLLREHMQYEDYNLIPDRSKRNIAFSWLN